MFKYAFIFILIIYTTPFGLGLRANNLGPFGAVLLLFLYFYDL